MESLEPEARELLPLFPFDKAIVVGSFCLRAYAEKYGLKLPDDCTPADVDIVVDEPTFAGLETAGWVAGVFNESPTLRDTDSNGRHTYDVGKRAHVWSYEQLREHAIEHQGIYYMDPLSLLLWKLRLNRKKDLPHIRFIAEQVLPAWLETNGK